MRKCGAAGERHILFHGSHGSSRVPGVRTQLEAGAFQRDRHGDFTAQGSERDEPAVREPTWDYTVTAAVSGSAARRVEPQRQKELRSRSGFSYCTLTPELCYCRHHDPFPIKDNISNGFDGVQCVPVAL